LTYNGGLPETTVCVSDKEKFSVEKGFGITEFFGVDLDVETNNLIYYFESQYGKHIVKPLLPIADACNCLVCIGIEGEYYGKVFYWDIDEAGETDGPNAKAPTFDCVTEIAPGFLSFSKMLVSEDEL